MSRYFIVREKEKEILVEMDRRTLKKMIKWMNKLYDRKYEIVAEITQEEFDEKKKQLLNL